MAVFIGGDTQELEFDFSTKVAGSMVECPLNLYRTFMPTIQPPTNIVTDSFFKGFKRYDEQPTYDKIKKQGDTYFSTNDSNNNNISQFMVELDLNPLCNTKFGGSHEALKSAIRRLEVNVWASSSGDNGGSLGYKCLISPFAYVGTPFWAGFGDFRSISSQIKKITYDSGQGVNSRNKLSPDNRIYILIASGYPSSATIPSTLNLDYINVKLTLARTPDVLKFTDSEGNKKDYLDVELKDEWSVYGSIFPSYSSEDIANFNSPYAGILDINDGTWDNRLFLQFNKASPNHIGSTYFKNREPLFTFNQSVHFSKFTNIKFLVQVKKNKITVYFLINNDSILKNEGILIDKLLGKCKMYIGSLKDGSSKLDGFIERFNFFDYAIAQNDQEAEVILKGRNEIDVNNSRLNELGKQFENPNLCPKLSDFRKEGATIEEKSISKLVISNNHTKDNDHEQFAMSPRFQLLPNNHYELIVDCEVTNSCEVFVLNYHSKYGIILNAGQLGSGVNKFTFTTTNNNCPVMEQYIRLDVNNYNSKLVVNSIKLRRLD